MEAVSLPPNASPAEIENELLFQAVLQESLDPMAFNYEEQKAQIESTIAELNARLDEARMATQSIEQLNDVSAHWDNGQSRKRQRDLIYLDDDDEFDDDPFQGPLPKSHRASPSAYDDRYKFGGVASPRSFNNPSSVLERARE